MMSAWRGRTRLSQTMPQLTWNLRRARRRFGELRSEHTHEHPRNKTRDALRDSNFAKIKFCHEKL
jgi:hypothetical protein